MGKGLKPFGAVNLILGAACAGLAFMVIIEFNEKPGAAPIIVTPEEASIGDRQQKSSVNLSLPPLATLTELAERPLFSPTRRPPVLKTKVPPKPVTDLKLALIGVIVRKSDSLAIVKKLDTGESLRLTSGQDINGWSVEEVLSDRVLFRNGKDLQELLLRNSKKLKK